MVSNVRAILSIIVIQLGLFAAGLVSRESGNVAPTCNTPHSFAHGGTDQLV
jgi:hypothetical protein